MKGTTLMNVLDYELLDRYERKKKTKLTLQESLAKLPEGERRQLVQKRIADIERDQLKLLAALFVAGIEVDTSDMPDMVAIREWQQHIRENKE